MRAAFHFSFFGAVLLFFSATSNAVDVNPESLQAAYIQKFISYIEWPVSSDEKFIIAVVKNSPMFEALSEVFGNSVISGKPVQVIKLEKIDKKISYSILHISKIESAYLKELNLLRQQGLLIITEHDTGLGDYSQINFFLDTSGKLRFDINQTTALEHGLKINSRLLNLARSLK